MSSDPLSFEPFVSFVDSQSVLFRPETDVPAGHVCYTARAAFRSESLCEVRL